MRVPENTSWKCQGFTLIEVLVAFSILSMSLSVLFALLSTGSRNTQVSDEYNRAVVLAESKLDELGVTKPLHTGLTSGVFDSTYHWELRVERRLRRDKDFDRDLDWKLFDVSLRVWWQSMGQERDISLATIRLSELE